VHVADYVTPDIIQEIGDVGAVAVAITAIGALIYTIAKIAIWLDKRKDDRFAARVKEIMIPIIENIVYDATANIRTGKNGGYSLTDMHERMDKELDIPIAPRPTILGDEHSDLD
jgi:hypothetical protein